MISVQDPRLSALFDRYRRQGDLASLAKLFDDLSPEMMRVARHVAGRGVDPEDVVQSTFLAAIERAEAFDATRPLVPWLMGILINQARLANRRRATRHEEAAGDDLASDAVEPDDAEAHEVRDAVARALADLPETYREVLIAHLAEGKKPHEIAAELGRPQGTVRAQLFRGLRLIRGALPSGFALGVMALLDRSALASVRRVVLAEAARAQGLGPAAAASIARAPLKVSPLVGVAGAAAVLLLVLGFAWRAGSVDDVDIGRPAAESPPIAAAEPGENGVRHPGERELSAPPPAIQTAGAAAPTPFGALLVRVRDARGQPARGVRVDILPWGDPLWHVRSVSTATLADGTVHLARLYAGRVGVHLDGGQQSRAEIVAGVTSELELTLPAGLAIEGLVLDDDGTPAEGALVEVLGLRETAPRNAAEPTGPGGRFRLEDVARAHSIGAHADGRAPSQLVWLGVPAWKDVERVHLTLRLGARVAPCDVEVVDQRGEALAGAEIVASSGAPAGRFRGDGAVEIGSAPVRAVADAFGRARLWPARESGARIVVRAAGFAPAELELPAAHALVTLRRGAQVRGRAHYEDGSLAEGALVRALPAGWREPLETRADAAGAWRLDALPTGDVELRAQSSPEAPFVAKRLALADGDEATWDPVVAPALLIRGKAYTEKGAYSRIALVKAVREGEPRDWTLADWAAAQAPFDSGRQLRQCWTGNDGSFAVPCEPGARYRLELRPRGAWLGAVMGAREGVEAGAQDVELRARPGRAWIRGRVLAAGGLPLAASLIALRRGSVGDQRGRAQRESGEFAFDLAPGAYELLAWPDGALPRSLGEREVLDDEAWDLGDVVIAPPGSVRIPAARGEEVVLADADGLPLALAREGTDLVARGLPPGRYVVHRPGGAVQFVVESGLVVELPGASSPAVPAQNDVRSVK